MQYVTPITENQTQFTLDESFGSHELNFWRVSDTRVHIQSRDPDISRQLRRLKSARRVAYGCLGGHLEVYSVAMSGPQAAQWVQERIQVYISP